jgi:hypothetical protein
MSSCAAAEERGASAQGGPGDAESGKGRGPASPTATSESGAQSPRQDEQHRPDAQQGNAEGETHPGSAEFRVEHALERHAAHAARLADKNAANRDRRERHRGLRGKNRGEHGPK